jgi:hypothetical protein
MVFCKQTVPEHRKTNVIKCITKNSPQYPLNIGYNDKYIEEGVNTKFLGLQIDNNLNWKSHQLIPQLSGTCFAVRFMSHVSNTDTIKSVYFVYFRSLMKYGIIIWGNSSDSKKVFSLQKKIVRIMTGVKPHDSCRDLFKRLQILTFPCVYIYIYIYIYIFIN